jgi:transketolase
MGEQITYSISESIESSTEGVSISYYPKEAFDLLLQNELPLKDKTFLFAQMARFNTLYMVARAGSGHLGGSFSSLDVVSWLYLNELKQNDRYFSSKGHDAPGLYSIHTALGIIPFEKIHTLRRLGGLPGHPDVNIPGAHTNTGSLGMGVSKAKGFMFADQLLNKNAGRVFVLTGDGELQEGQFWESLVTASRLRNGLLTVIVDHNKLQSDTFVSNVSDLGDLDAKFRAFGFEVCRIDGHDYQTLSEVIGKKGQDGKPLAIIADTIKGKGVSFMEHIIMAPDQEYYKYHSGAPSPEDYLIAKLELKSRIDSLSGKLGLDLPKPVDVSFEPLRIPASTERMIPAYSEAILEQAGKNPMVVALDADLILDTGLIPFKNEFPDRFIECGIAEQDMVSQAGTMALAGLIPVVHSFACFLTSRASEQIYNNCTQMSKVIYIGSLAGVLPGGPGASHQAVRDLSAMSAMPGLTILEPVSASQVSFCLDWAINHNEGSTYIRLTSIPLERRDEFNKVSNFKFGEGDVLREGSDATFLTLGPIMTIEALKASDKLSSDGIECKVIGISCANSCDGQWLDSVLKNSTGPLIIIENHLSEGGFGERISKILLLNRFSNNKIKILGIEGLPQSGTNVEVLKAHQLDSDSLGDMVRGLV